MRSSTRSLLLLVVMLVALNARAQTEAKQSTERAGSIRGRVTVGGKPAPGVKVIAFKHDRHSQDEPVASAKTDQDGNFQLTRLPSDQYRIMPLAPAYVAPEQAEPGRPGKNVPLAEGETIEGLDFALVRGGVITGRITDEDGQPLTGEMITLFQFDAGGQKRPLYYISFGSPYFSGTNDQGIYRIFGLPPGRYLVSAGQDTEQGGSEVGKSRYHPRTFYPGVSDESKANIVELTAGTEATGIDIAFGRPLKTYSASGRVIDASTGRPLPNARIGHGMVHETKTGDSTSTSSSFSRGPDVDARGNFRLDGLTPGTFYVKATPEAEDGLYSNVVSFQIKDQDVTGLEIKVARGSSISGMLAVEGASDPELIKRLSRLKLWASVSSPDILRGADNESRVGAVNPDGGFNIAGLHPGKVSVGIVKDPDSKGFFVSRVERGGVEQPNGVEVGSGEHVAGLRVILGYGSGRIRGQVKIEGGKVPPDARISLYVWRVDGSPTHSFTDVEVDPNGRFVVEDLITGEYEMTITVTPPFPPGGGTVRPLAESVRKKVSVTNGVESEVTLVVKLFQKGKDQ
jgi:5-hydroxyisourate hydrolase-like protein (transthyretin family)